MPTERDFDDPWDDVDESDESDWLPCPECGAEIYADAPRCPHCGNYVTFDADSGRPAWAGRAIKITVIVLLAALLAPSLLMLWELLR